MRLFVKLDVSWEKVSYQKSLKSGPLRQPHCNFPNLVVFGARGISSISRAEGPAPADRNAPPRAVLYLFRQLFYESHMMDTSPTSIPATVQMDECTETTPLTSNLADSTFYVTDYVREGGGRSAAGDPESTLKSLSESLHHDTNL